ncbi:MAG: hypothetical protein KBT10_05440 [Bacteroidales bacterium]|nr:hypothetical protein [Candidatus Sodaliphilus aphodohippi]
MGINLPIAGQILMPYAFTGPNFSFLFNESVGFKWENRDSNISWDVGAGVEILKHIQVQAAYGIGLTKALKQMGIEQECASIVGKDRSWTITAAYLF